MPFFCPDIIPAAVEWGGHHANVSPFVTRTGFVRRTARNTDRQRARLRYTNLHNKNTAAELARMSAFKDSLRGRLESFYLPNHAYQRRGSFPASELLSNSIFANGTSGFTTSSGYALTAADRLLRATRVAAASANLLYSPQATAVQYAPCIVRYFGVGGRGLFPGSYQLGAGSTFSGFEYGAAIGAPTGMRTFAFVPSSTAAFLAIQDSNVTGQLAGDYLDVAYTSLSRCVLADGGGNNLLRSDELENAAWTPSGLSSRVANASTGPDGTAASDELIENSSAGSPGISQSQARTNVAADLCSFGYFKRGAGTRNVRLWIGNDGTNGGSAIFDLGGGTFSTVTNNGTATNARAFIRDFGNGHYFCCVIARLPPAATLAVFVELANGTSVSYTGDGTSSILGWRVGGVPSSVPTRGTQTTTVAIAPSSQQGTGIHVKGLPVSTDGLLLVDDMVEVNSRLRRVAAPLNSDAAGLGFLQLGWPVGPGLANDAPIIVHRPMAKFMLVEDEQMIGYRPGIFGDVELDCIEDLTP